MQVSKIALACSLACAAMSASAASVPVPAGTVTVFLSGATAPDSFMGDIASGMMTGVTAIRSNDSGILHRAYLGKANGIAGIANGTDVLFVKRSKGGSVWGVDPVARANRVETIDLDNCVAGTSPWAYSCGVKGIDPGIAGNEDVANPGLVPDFGVSDVEPRMFKEPFNTENGQPQLSADEAARLSNAPVNQIMMGIVATNAVSESTHISRSAYGAMLSGRIQDWSSIDGSTDPVVVCRRVNGSGTQTSYNWFTTGFPCNVADSGYLDTPPATVFDSAGFGVSGTGTELDPFIIDASAGYTVIENSGSGDVRNCLKAANNGGVFKVKGSNDVWYQTTFTAGTKAIGVLSLDSYGKESGWKFRMLDGAGSFNATTQTASAGATGLAPSKNNLLNGKYDFVVELSMQYRNAEVTNVNGDVVAVPNAAKQAVIDEFIKRAGDTKYTGNEGGVFVSVPNAYASLPQYYSYASKPLYVAKFSRNGNTCAPLVGY